MLLQTTPTFPELIGTLWNFVIAWAMKYWWAIAILLIFIYVRHYRDTNRSGVRNPAIRAASATFQSIAEQMTKTTIRLAGVGLFAVAGVVWLLQAVGTMLVGVTGGDPIIIANVAALFASIGAALGIDRITPGVTVGIFIAALGIVLIVLQANEYAEEQIAQED